MAAADQAVHDEVAALTLKVARPLIWHDRTEGWPKRLDGATCFFSDLKVASLVSRQIT